MNKKMNRSAVCSLVVVAGMMLCAPKANAQAVTSAWSSAVNGSWDEGAKWSSGTPLAGTNALLGIGGSSYTVDYTNPVNYKIGALIITNTTGNMTTLNINTNGFNFNGGKIYKATININPGGVVTNTAQFEAVAADSSTTKVILDGGRLATTTHFGYTGFSFIITSGECYATGGYFFPYLTMTGGTLVVSSGVSFRLSSGFISGGKVTSAATISALNTITITSNAQVETVGYVVVGQTGATSTLGGGALDITGNTFQIGNQGYTGNRSGYFVQTGGTLNMTNPAGLVIGYSDPGIDSGTINRYQLTNGVANLEKITLNGPAAKGGRKIFETIGGTLNLGSGGIINGGGLASSVEIYLSGGTLGAQGDWASSLNMTVTNKPGPGTVTFRAADTNDVAYDIALSGILSGNGALTKTGAGALLLDGMNTYTGLTTVVEGTLGGTGSIAGTTTVASNAFVSGGSITAVGTLTVTNLVIQEGAGLAWKYGTATRDVIAVSGKLTLATNAVVNVSAAEGATFSQLPAISVLATYGSKDGATTLDGWKVTGLPASSGARVQLDVPNKQVRLLTNRGTMISIM